MRATFYLPLIFALRAMPAFPDYAPSNMIDQSVASQAALDRLMRGEVLVENAHVDESGGSVRVQVLMHTDVQTVWEYIASCDSVFQYVDGLRHCEVKKVEYETGADITTLSQSIKKSWIVPRIDYVISVRREPYHRVDFSLIEGDLRTMEGGWRFEQLPGGEGLVVTHEIRVRPSFPVPRWLLRRSMRKDVPDMLACLRGLTNGSGEFSVKDDLDRCPRPHRKRD